MSIFSTSTMDKNDFWALIEDAKSATNRDLRYFADYLTDQLRQMDEDNVQAFDHIVHTYYRLANKAGLWTIASVIKDGCTDDAFIEFICWLIAQGKETYFKALENLDTLANIDIVRDPIYGVAEFGDLMYLGSSVYEEMTGSEMPRDLAYSAMLEVDLAEDVHYMEGIEKWIGVSEIVTCFPEICRKYIDVDALG